MDDKLKANTKKESRVFHRAHRLGLRERIALRFAGWRDGRHGVVGHDPLGGATGGILDVLSAQAKRDKACNISIATSDKNPAEKRKAYLKERIGQIEANRKKYETDKEKALQETQSAVRDGEEGLSKELLRRRRVREVETEFSSWTKKIEDEKRLEEAFQCEIRELDEEISSRNAVLTAQVDSVYGWEEDRRAVYMRSVERAEKKKSSTTVYLGGAACDEMVF